MGSSIAAGLKDGANREEAVENTCALTSTFRH